MAATIGLNAIIHVLGLGGKQDGGYNWAKRNNSLVC